MPTALAESLAPTPSNGARLVATDGRPLALERTTLRAEARGGLARVVVEQRFTNPYDEPLAVTYLLPLPADGAVSGFAFTLGDRRIVGEVDRRAAARESFEAAVLAGRTAALLEQERSNTFTQELGNVPPRASIVATVTVDQRLAWRSEGAWEWRFPTVVAPRYLGASGRVPDAGRVIVDVADGAPAPTLAIRLVVSDSLAPGGRIEGVAHPLDVQATSKGQVVTLLAAETVPDRDVVVRWPVAGIDVGVGLVTARPDAAHARAASAFGLLTLVPPHPTAPQRVQPRDLTILLDTSGSMIGAPLAQAVAVVTRLVERLGDEDTLELIAFGDHPNPWRSTSVRATAVMRREALHWLAARCASGGTEMLGAIDAALVPLRLEAQRQVVLVTDGLVGFEAGVVSRVWHGLPVGARLHVVGVGDAVNRSLSGPLARAGRGTETVVGLDDPASVAADRLDARLAAPVLTDLAVSGEALVSTAPARLPDVFAGAPLVAGVDVRPDGGRLIVEGRRGAEAWSTEIVVPAVGVGEGPAGIVALFAREAVEDLEVRGAAGEQVDLLVEQLGLVFQIATRRTSWVAVSATPTVDPRHPTRWERIAQALPHGISVEGLGLRAAGVPPAHVQQMLSRGAIAGTMPPEVLEETGIVWDSALKSAARPSPDAPAAPSGGRLMRMIRRLQFVQGTPLLRVVGVFRWLRDQGVLVVEITLRRAVSLDYPAGFELRFANGDAVAATLDPARSTAPGDHAAGQTIRLVLVVAGGGRDDLPRMVVGVEKDGNPMLEITA
jgi:Ca-activated chloride channel homolog